MEHLEIELLGKVARGSSLGKSIFPAKGYVLIAALTLASGFQMTRMSIATLLWENSEQSAALSNLRQLIIRMNPKCEPALPLITSSKSHLSLSDRGQTSLIF